MSPTRGSARPKRTAAVPRRDADGRVVSLPEMVGVAAGLLVVNGVGLIAIDGLLALLRLSSFGRASGWLVLILPALLYFEDFRAWRAYRLRWLVGPVSALVGVVLGLFGAGFARDLGPLGSGAVGALVAVLAYAPVWFVGIRLVTAARTEDS
jgi:hypothetical protein